MKHFVISLFSISLFTFNSFSQNDGSIDLSFNASSLIGTVRDVAIDNNGKLIIAGGVDNQIARLHRGKMPCGYDKNPCNQIVPLHRGKYGASTTKSHATNSCHFMQKMQVFKPRNQIAP